jgi:hypothetical protein
MLTCKHLTISEKHVFTSFHCWYGLQINRFCMRISKSTEKHWSHSKCSPVLWVFIKNSRMIHLRWSIFKQYLTPRKTWTIIKLLFCRKYTLLYAVIMCFIIISQVQSKNNKQWNKLPVHYMSTVDKGLSKRWCIQCKNHMSRIHNIWVYLIVARTHDLSHSRRAR